jgi:hypothetical protein
MPLASSKRRFPRNFADYLTSSNEYDNKQRREDGVSFENSGQLQQIVDRASTGYEIPPGEDGMDFEKENFEDENELSRLEDDEELGGESQEMVETEEEELAIVGEEPDEEAPAPRPAPAARPAPKKAAKKKAAPKKKAKAKPRKKAAKKPARKAGKKKRR